MAHVQARLGQIPLAQGLGLREGTAVIGKASVKRQGRLPAGRGLGVPLLGPPFPLQTLASSFLWMCVAAEVSWAPRFHLWQAAWGLSLGPWGGPGRC